MPLREQYRGFVGQCLTVAGPKGAYIRVRSLILKPFPTIGGILTMGLGQKVSDTAFLV